MLKKILTAFFAVSFLLFAGCSDVDHSSRKDLAESFVEAVSDNDAEALWEAFAPAMREEMAAKFNGDEEKAKEALLKVMSDGIVKRYQLQSAGEIGDSDEVSDKICNDLLKNENNFVKIDDEWFFNVPLSK